ALGLVHARVQRAHAFGVLLKQLSDIHIDNLPTGILIYHLFYTIFAPLARRPANLTGEIGINPLTYKSF
ncbi:MAG: hypothetical protein IKE76_15660, partial [Clostridia bacterium]|nr:hypothetical protein [Clostridia bacterium]